MNPYLNILVGINYTDASRHALTKANRIAAENGAKITACHVVPMGDFNEFVDFYMIEHAVMMNAAQSSLEAFVEEVLGDDHEVECHIAEGIPHHELVSRANEEGNDLLVLGDDDYADDPRKAGQFAIKCLRFATMPVLLVNRPPQDADEFIAACVDFSGSTLPILQNAARIALGDHAKLQVIHSSRPPWLRPVRLRYRTDVLEKEEQQDVYREILDGQLAGIRNQAATIFPGEVDHLVLESNDPTKAMLDYFHDSPCGLIIIGRSGKGLKGILSDFLGGTAESLIRHAGCPILIVPITK